MREKKFAHAWLALVGWLRSTARAARAAPMIALALLIASCSDSAPTAAATTTPAQPTKPTTSLPPIVPIPAQWQGLERPLRLPVVTGTDCPASSTSELGRQHVRGDGPVRLSAEGAAYLQIGSTTSGLALPTIKPYWLWKPGFASDVLLRGKDLRDGSPMLFAEGSFDTAPRTWKILQHNPQSVGDAATGGWDITAHLAWVIAPGCYGLQLDSAEFSTVIVTEVR